MIILMEIGLGGKPLNKCKYLKLVGYVNGILRKTNKGKCIITSREELGNVHNPLKAQDK